MKMWVNTGIKLYTHCISTEAAVELGRSWIYPRITLSCLDHAVLSGGTGILIKTLFVLQYCVCISSLVPSVLHFSYGFQCSFFLWKDCTQVSDIPSRRHLWSATRHHLTVQSLMMNLVRRYHSALTAQ